MINMISNVNIQRRLTFNSASFKPHKSLEITAGRWSCIRGTPKGFHNTAQGCREAATLGKESLFLYPEGVASMGRRLSMKPLWGTQLGRMSPQGSREARQPWAMRCNAFGVKAGRELLVRFPSFFGPSPSDPLKRVTTNLSTNGGHYA